MSDDGIENHEISHVTVQELADAIQQCSGHYSFLIGAGTSAHDIPTAGTLINQWREEKYEALNPNKDFEEWVDQKEPGRVQKEGREYGFWFEQRHKSIGKRRHFIENLVKDATPNFGHIVLASMMSGLNRENDEGKNHQGYIPVTLTPNFDDLLYDAFYLFLEDKPLMVDHNVIASQFQLTRDRPTIIKLHGDYLYNNIQNTEDETANLEDNIERALSLVLQEYGMIVLGYSGEDDSIMNVFEDDDFEVPDYGLFWCTRNADDLADRVKKLLQKDNAFAVEIDGAESFFNEMYEFLSDNDGFSVPDPDGIEKRAEERANKLREVVEEGGPDSLELKYQGNEYLQNEDYEKAVESYTEAIQQDPMSASAYNGRGKAKGELGKLEDAIEDYSQAIQIRPDSSPFYNNRGTAKIKNEKYKSGIEDLNQAIELDSENPTAYANRGLAKSWFGDYEAAIKNLNKALELDQQLMAAWNGRGLVRLGAGDYELAKEDFDRAIEIDSKNNQLYNNKGVAYNLLGNHIQAIEEFKIAIELDPDSIRPRQHLSETYILSGDYDEALNYLQNMPELEDSVEETAVNLFLTNIAKIMLNADVASSRETFRKICNKEFKTTFWLKPLKIWLKSTEIPEDKRIEIENVIELLEPHQEDKHFWAVSE